jgi:hypothetical protein
MGSWLISWADFMGFEPSKMVVFMVKMDWKMVVVYGF